MFTLNDMRTLLNARPFVPFRIWLSDGGHITVRSSEQMMLFRRYAIVGLLDPDALEESFDRHVVVWYMHITRCEELTPGSSPFTSPGAPPFGAPSPAGS